MQGKKAITRSCPPNLVKQGGFAIKGILNLLKQVNVVVGLPKVILYIVILRRDAKFDELVFESSGLFKKAMYFSCDLHNDGIIWGGLPLPKVKGLRFGKSKDRAHTISLTLMATAQHATGHRH